MPIHLALWNCAASVRRIGVAQTGASSVEFALIAPVLCLMLLTAVDLGTALSERLAMSQILRSGAQVAMEDPGAGDVEQLMKSTASGNFQTEIEEPSNEQAVVNDPLDLSVDRYCACPDSAETAVSCSTVCTGTVPTFIYYEMSAEKSFSGVVLRGLPLAAAAHVQVR